MRAEGYSVSDDDLVHWVLCLALLGCNQERNKSIELMNHGVEMARQKLYDRAVADLKQAVTIDPSNHLAYFNLGIVYKDQKKWKDPATLVFAYTPVEDPAVYQNIFKPFTDYLGTCTGNADHPAFEREFVPQIGFFLRSFEKTQQR